MTNQEIFTKAYLEAIYFTETGDCEQPPSDAELTPLSRCNALNDCASFWRAYADLIPASLIEQAGHDLWFTRNGHGVGYWDRPELYGDELADQLTRASRAMGEVWVEFEDTEEEN